MGRRRTAGLSFVLAVVSCLVMSTTCSAEWKTHDVQQLNGSAERLKLPAQFQIMTESWHRVVAVPYIVYMPEKDRVLMLVSCDIPHQAMVLESDDHGDTWSEPRLVHSDEAGKGDTGIGLGLAYLGSGNALLRANMRWFSRDYGRTWTEHLPLPPGPAHAWDPPFVDRDPKTGKVTRLWESIYEEDHSHPRPWSQAYLRWSADEGCTWSDLVKVPQWAGANEVALIRAKNGDLVAACRTDWPDKFAATGLDHYQGLGVSVSKDDGRTWSELTRLYEWGRHHPSMVLLPDGRIVMTYVVRKGYVDTPEGFPQFGVEAVVSRDNGATWDLDHRYILADWPGNRKDAGSWHRSSQATSSVLLPDGSILTAFGTGYRTPPERDVGLVRWRVNNKGLNDDRTVAGAPFDSDLRNLFDPHQAVGAEMVIPSVPTFQELMDPAQFPSPQHGMEVESVTAGKDSVRIRTTGARITINLPTGEVAFDQRIGHERPLAVLRIGKTLRKPEITHSGPGFARIVFEQPALTIRVNGDSLFMLHAREPLDVSVDRRIDFAWNASFETNHLIADEWGAFGLYCSERRLDDRFNPGETTVAAYPLPSDAVLWVAVCPPKAYDWQRSLADRVVWHWSDREGYPSDNALRSWKAHGNIVLLQSEVMLWKDWNLDFVPRLGPGEFARVRKTLHDLGMRFIVYTSPYYFLKGTALEPRAMNSFENFKAFPPGTRTGENMDLFLPAIRRVMEEYKPDGLYFDGQYIGNPAALYALARHAREIVGEDRILEWHSTAALGYGLCYLPQADAYVDFILRGEGRKRMAVDFSYLRFFVSGYNISNAVGVICNNAGMGATPEMVDNVLRANARFHVILTPEIMEVLKKDYWPRLVPDLREAVLAGVDARQAKVAEQAAARRAESEALEKPPAWGAPVFRESFDRMPDAKRLVSPKNPDPFTIADGSLHVRAYAHTFAYLSIPLDVKAAGIVVRIRQGTDGGMSWGPSVMLRWADGWALRIGTRGDGTLQADVPGRQFHGSAYDMTRWVWLRARWLDNLCVIERSADGVTFERLWTLDGSTAFAGRIAELSVGKVPYDGRPADYTEPGQQGECDVDFVEVYGR